MEKVCVTCGWEGLPPLDSQKIIELLPPTSGIQEDPSDPTRVIIDKNRIPNLKDRLKIFGIGVTVVN